MTHALSLRLAGSLASIALGVPLLVACGPAGPAPPPLPELGDLAHVEASLRTDAHDAHTELVADPADPARWVALARALDRCEAPALAETVWAGAATLEPGNRDWAYFAGVSAARSLQPIKARRWFEAVLELDDTDAYAWRQLGSLALDMGEADRARAAFQRVAELQPRAHDGYTGLALVALGEGDAETALRNAERARRCAPENVYQRYLFGVALRAAGRVDEARPHLTAGEGSALQWAEAVGATGEGGGLEAGLMARADRLAGEARLPEAEALYRRVLALRPEDGRVRTRLAIILSVQGRADEGLELLEEVLRQVPNHYFLLKSKADVLQIAGRPDEARAVLEAAIEAWPERAGAWVQLGALELEVGREGGARDAFERAFGLDPTDTKAIYFHAQQLVRDLRVEDAAALLEDAVPRVDGAPAELLSFMLQVQQTVGRDAATLAATRELIRRTQGTLSPPTR